MSGYGRPSYSSTPHIILLFTVVTIFLMIPQFIPEQINLQLLSEINPLMVMAAPLFLVLVIRWLSSKGAKRGPYVGVPYSPSTSSSASPLGVAIVLFVVLLMVWYQSSEDFEAL